MSDVLGKLKEIVDQMPEAPKAPTPVIEADRVLCACGKKKIHISEVKRLRTSTGFVLDYICDECERMVPNHSRIVCLRCRKVVSRMPPHKDPSGFVFEARKFYHVDACPDCQPGLTSSNLLEKQQFDAERRGK
jgi:hypothetical protein